MSPLLSTLVNSILFAPLILASTEYEIRHRFLSHPSSSTANSDINPFVHLGYLNPLLSQPEGQTASDPWLGVAQIRSDGTDHEGETEMVDDGRGWYQVGLVLDQGDDEDEWMIASTRAGYLSSRPKVKIGLDSAYIPTHVSVHPSATGLTNTNGTSVKLPKGPNDVVWEFHPVSKTKNPSLAPPPPVDTATGAPLQPVPEKSFMAKYWMYITGAVLFLLIQLGPDDPRGAPAPAK
ncbi:hypothetical protein IAR55_003170 [Kwoniella newhampshirensis]|uniref:ER membrane protein complex subunit 10 n=1 Tax=Kwoniella newhampshirensis TaxID=1651941 RepID=A0AAW0YPM6_9TREE